MLANMGMYTRYRLEAPADAIAWLRAHNDEARFAIDADGDPEEAQTWYGHQEDVQRVSKGFPEHLITLHGEGEEPGDLWRKYFRAGRVQEARAVMTYPECELDYVPESDSTPDPEITAWVERRHEAACLRRHLAELEE